jgi:diguanylate cyclase (GGDEF)-like protein/PAS domain S-box-containing protein
MVHPDDLDSVQERINILFSGQPDERAYRIVTHSGEIRWLRDSACAERNSQQRSVYILGAAQDITEQKLAEDAINESRARLQAMFDNATVGVVLVNPGGRFIEVNERWATMLGCTHETIYQKTYLDITHPDDIAASLDYMHALVNQEKENFHMEKRYVRLDGSIFWGDVSVRVVRNDQGQLEGLIGVVVDITERKQVENALRLSEQKFRSFVEQSTYGISLCNAEGVIIEWNRAQEQITGIMREEALGCALWDIQFALGLEERRTPAAYANLQTLAKEFFRTGQAAWVNQIIEIEIQRPDDTRCMLQTLTFPVQTEHGFMAGTIATDVTEHVQLKQSLHAREEQFRTLVDSMDDIVFMLDREQRHIGVFGHWLERYGLKTEDFLGKTARQTSPDEATALIHEAANERALKGEYVVYEWSIGHPPVYIQTSLSPIRADNGEITGLVGVGRDITALREVQTALQESNYRIRNVLESITDAFFALDQQYRFTYLNQHAAHLLQRQRDDLLGKCVWDEFPEAAETIFFSEYQRVMEQRVPARFEAFYMPFDAWFDVHAYPLDGGLSVYFQDITARKHTEEALQQANHDLTRWVSALEQRAREITLLNDMGDLLQTCRTEEEAYIVVSQIMTRLFPNESGTLYILSPSRTLAEGMAHWGSLTLPQTLVPDDCWALRRGHMHVSQQTSVGLVCQHLQTPLPACALCVPMMAQSEMLGIFHLCREQGVFSEATKQLAITVAEHIALALATLRLQETLRHQAIRDSLTGLYNRRYMEESLEREMGRAIRRSSSLGVIMLDLDHFKRFNDTYGHAAGDAVLRELGAFLKSHIRSEDIACRYGGEEFALIILDADLHSVRRIAEHMCASVHHLNVWSHGQSLGRVTLSLGAAIFPEDGTTADEVIRAADAALYQAKAQGRDRVVLSQDIACT